MDKKAFAISFQWIFVTIVGAIILIFFVRFALQHKDTSDVISARQISSGLSDSLEAFGTSLKSDKNMALGLDTEINFDCDSYTILDYTKKTDQIIFSHPVLKGNILYAWTQSWKFPFKITNFFYLANKNVRYLLIYDQDTYNYVSSLNIPERFNVQTLPTTSISINREKQASATLDKVVFVFFTTPDDGMVRDILNQVPRSAVLRIDKENNEVTFYTPTTSFTSFYLEKPLLYGAIFTADYDAYECLLKRSLQKLSLISDIYSKKAYYLWLKTNDENCKYRYNEISKTLTEFQSLQTKNEFYSYFDKINEQNKNLNKNDCPLIY